MIEAIIVVYDTFEWLFNFSCYNIISSFNSFCEEGPVTNSCCNCIAYNALRKNVSGRCNLLTSRVSSIVGYSTENYRFFVGNASRSYRVPFLGCLDELHITLCALDVALKSQFFSSVSNASALLEWLYLLFGKSAG